MSLWRGKEEGGETEREREKENKGTLRVHVHLHAGYTLVHITQLSVVMDSLALNHRFIISQSRTQPLVLYLLSLVPVSVTMVRV